MITVFKYVPASSKKFSRENSYFNGKERIGYEFQKIDEKDLAKFEAKGWSCSLPEKGQRKVKENVEHSEVSDIITSTESSGPADEVQTGE